MAIGCGFPACLRDFRPAPRWRCQRVSRRASVHTSRTGGRSAKRLRSSSGFAVTPSALSARMIPNYTGEPFDVTDSAVSGNVGVTWSVTDHVNLTALVARGFRTPNLQERSFFGLATNGEAYILQNPDLELGELVELRDRHQGALRPVQRRAALLLQRPHRLHHPRVPRA